MDDKDKMKELYKAFGEKKKDNEEFYSIANVFYEIGNKIVNKAKTESELRKRA
ncbi:hypothetical protein [Tissierella praeacuta]|uniref:hypothetical protein n=1 Tax=Tissierella praeacuta TaxID=43131 RepID=UPI0028AD31F2|nr:hypothetical protein [Tissierella praeacuta]